MHLLTPTYALFPEIAQRCTETQLAPGRDFALDLAELDVPGGTTLVPAHPNLLVTRTLSKAHSLAGFRVGHAILPEPIADDLSDHNDTYHLARPSEAVAIATLRHEARIADRMSRLREWTEALAAQLRAQDNARFVEALRELI